MASTDKFVQNNTILRTFKERLATQIGPDIQIGWVMGTDNFSPHCAVPGMHQIVVENRDPGSAKEFASRKKHWENESIHFLQAELLRVSSTKVRELSNARDLEALS